jgi:RNA polymerase sigma factor (sigma-70 family)
MEHQARRAADERSLSRRLLTGDEAALGELYDQHAGFVFGLALRVIGDKQTAEDVTQDVFVAFWKDPSRFDPDRGTLRAFLGTITHSRAVDVIRREEARRRREDRVAAEPRVVPPVDDTVTRAAISDALRAAVAQLPPAQREALELAYFEGHTYRQVAAALAIPEGTAKSRLRLGLQHLAELVHPELSEPWA